MYVSTYPYVYLNVSLTLLRCYVYKGVVTVTSNWLPDLQPTDILALFSFLTSIFFFSQIAGLVGIVKKEREREREKKKEKNREITYTNKVP